MSLLVLSADGLEISYILVFLVLIGLGMLELLLIAEVLGIEM